MIDASSVSYRKKTATTAREAKIPPHSHEAEQAVLGGVMIDNSRWEEVQERLQSEDFFHPHHKTIFETMADLARRDVPFDVITLSESLKSADRLSGAGGEAYLFELASNTPSVANLSAYITIVSERALLRRLISIANDIADSAFNTEGREGVALLDEAESKIFQIAERKRRGSYPEDVQTVMAKSFERLQQLREAGQGITGLPTGYVDFDRMTSGLQSGELIIIAGRPSMGKTTFAMNIAEYAALKASKPILIFSMEMPTESLGLRLFSSLARIDQHKIRTGKLSDEDWMRVTSVVRMMSTNSSLFIDDTPALSPVELRARARRIAKQQGDLGLIVIDYLQLMRVPGFNENRVGEISEISRSLKALAKELRVPIIALSQLNRSLEQRPKKEPVMSDLRESGAIEQDADVIAFIYRDEVYNKDSLEKGIAKIIIAKQRNGPIGEFRLRFFGEYTRFDNLAAESPYS